MALSKKTRIAVAGYLFLLPNFIGFLVFTSIPVVVSLVLSFCKWDLFTPPKFVGVHNFTLLFHDADFWRYSLNTLFLMLANPFIMLSFLAVFAALGLHETGISEVKAVWLFVGIFGGSASWWIIFRLAAGWLRGHLERGGLHVINLAAGTLICGFGLWEFVDFLRHR